MPTVISILPYLAPIALITVALLALKTPGRQPRRVLQAASAATFIALFAAAVTAYGVYTFGATTSALIGVDGIGLSLRLDALSATMFLLVSFIGVIVVRYSRRYLDGDARHGAFVGGLCLTIAAVTVLVLSGNLVQLVLAWIATSLALHRLLVFYPERRGAVMGARKKYITARLGDAALIGAAALLFAAFGTTDIAAILTAAGAEGAPAGATAAAFLIVLAAVLKCAQFPTQGWLLEVMETPTPVSALLHAGIINAGGFLVIRFADVMLTAPWAMHVLALVGGGTALIGAVAMLTQTSVKVSLAWSTVAQMGFMLFQCGLGVFSLAVLHIVAHSLYKAHAFLSSGSVVEMSKTGRLPTLASVSPSAGALAMMTALIMFVGIGWLLGYTEREDTAVLALGVIVVLGLSHLMAQSFSGQSARLVIGKAAGLAAVTATAYFALQTGAAHLMAGTLPPPPVHDAAALAIMALTLASFALVTVLQMAGPALNASPTWRSLRVHVANGFYANAAFNRFVGAFSIASVNNVSAQKGVQQ